MISVICTIYNTRKYLRQCLDSIINQTYKDIQIVLIDDGATDGSDRILNEYAQKDKRIKLIHQDNKGHSESRNVGLSIAEGEYVYFIDSDDYIHPQTLELLYENMMQTSADISIGNVTRYAALDVSNNRYEVMDNMGALHILVDSVRRRYKDGRFLPICATWNKIFKKSLFDDIKFPTGRVHDDNATAHRLLYKARTIVLTHAVTYFYRPNQNGIALNGLYDEDMVAAYEDRINFFISQGLDEFLPLTYSRYGEVLYRTYLNLKTKDLYDKIMNYLDYIIPEIRVYKTIGLYFDNLYFLTGIVSWMYNLIQGLKDDYRFVIYTKHVSPRVADRFKRLAEIIEINEKTDYDCDILLNNSLFTPLPDCLKYKQLYGVIHCDYARFKNADEINLNPDIDYIAVSDIAADGVRKRWNIRCQSIEGLFVKTKPVCRKVLHLISATRFTTEKGFANFVKFAELLKDNDILFEWRIYADMDMMSARKMMPYPEMVRCNGIDHETLMNYMADADYVVQLSDSEGFGMVVHEALMMGTPVIASDIPIFSKYIKNGYNGYLLPVNMENVDVYQICNNIPKDFVYDNQYDSLQNQWKTILK